MTIKSEKEEKAKCFKFFPTGKNCLYFYFVMFLTLLIVITCIVSLIGGFLRDAGCDTQCTFQTLLSTCIAFWLQPPRL